MTPEQWQRSTEILDRLLSLPEAERSAAWQAEPESDPVIRAEVESLLAATSEAEGYLEEDILAERKLAVGTMIGPWRLEEEIGQGGMSIVYRAARAVGYEQRVAVKVIALPALLTDAMARQIQTRFASERQIVARLEHPNICKLVDGGTTADGQPYLVLEYVEGVDLLTYGADKSLDERLRLFVDVAQAVHYAHQRLVVHRDLKPSNILVSAAGHVKLLDFGIAKSLEESGWEGASERTSTMFRAATPAFASPEQLRGDLLTTATDVYSLGIILGKLTGEAAPEDLRAIVARATREDADGRYASAADLAADVERFRKGLPVTARQGNLRYLAAKWVSRHRVAFSLASLLLVLIVGSAALTFYQNRQISRERERASAVADFLRGLFQASDPEVNQGNRLTTRELLDQGAQSIQRAGIDPATRLELTETIADAYTGLGLYEQAVMLLLPVTGNTNASVEVRARAQGRAAFALAQLGRHEEAEKAAVQGVELARAARPASPALEAYALEQHCLALFQAAKYAAAAPLCEDAVAKAEAGEVAPLEQSRYLRSHGRALKNLSDFAGAERALNAALKLAREADGAASPTVAVALDELGGIYFRQGKFDEAIQHFQQSLESSRRLYPEGHVTLARTLNNLANVYATMRKPEEAKPVYQEAHVLYRKFLGQDSGELATSLSNFAILQQTIGQYQEAAETFEQVMAVHARSTGKDKLPYWSAALKLANLRLEQGKATAALKLAQDVTAALDGLTPKPVIERGFVRVVLAAALIESGAGAAALNPAEAAAEILNPVLSPKHWMRSYNDAAKAGALLARGRREEGRQLLEPLYRELEKVPAGGSWRADWMRSLWRRHQL